MALSPEVEARGMKAYEQARAFERLRSWRLPLSYAVCVLILMLSSAGVWALGHPLAAGFNFLGAVVLAGMARSHWIKLRANYAENLRLLAELEKTHGDELPWVQVEKHFAALDLLRRAGPADGSKVK